MSLMYPRQITLTRPSYDPGVGKVDYGGQVPRHEEVIAEGVQAAIQMKTGKGMPLAQLPGDASQRTYWKILIPTDAIGNWTVNTGDIVTDDAAVRYQVLGPYRPAAFGFDLLAERLES